MRRIVFMCALLALAVTGVRAQQGTPAAGTGPVIEKSPAVVPYKPAQLSEADQIQACPAKIDLHPEVDGVYKVGGDVKWPKPIHEVDATFSAEARKMIKMQHLKNFEAISLVSLVVDPFGNPQIVCVLKSAGYGLDEQAVAAAKQFRFQPATKDGVPVAVRISIEMNFKIY
jgi:TonB family protein